MASFIYGFLTVMSYLLFHAYLWLPILFLITSSARIRTRFILSLTAILGYIPALLHAPDALSVAQALWQSDAAVLTTYGVERTTTLLIFSLLYLQSLAVWLWYAARVVVKGVEK